MAGRGTVFSAKALGKNVSGTQSLSRDCGMGKRIVGGVT